MRVLIVCALVAWGFIYYMQQQDSNPSNSGSNLSPETQMTKCQKRRAKEYSTVEMDDLSTEQACAYETKNDGKNSSKYWVGQ